MINLNEIEDLEGYILQKEVMTEEKVDYYIGVLPPATWTKNIIQMGEISYHTDLGTPIYSTLVKLNDTWFYLGYCSRKTALGVSDRLLKNEVK